MQRAISDCVDHSHDRRMEIIQGGVETTIMTLDSLRPQLCLLVVPVDYFSRGAFSVSASLTLTATENDRRE